MTAYTEFMEPYVINKYETQIVQQAKEALVHNVVEKSNKACD